MKLGTYLSDRNISHAAFAAMIGVSQVTISRYVAGARVPRPEHMRCIREATKGKVTADDFFPTPEREEA